MCTCTQINKQVCIMYFMSRYYTLNFSKVALANILSNKTITNHW